MIDLLRELAYEAREWREHDWPLSTLWVNFRFVVGYAIGGFTAASRD